MGKLSWVLCLGSHKANIKVLAALGYYLGEDLLLVLFRLLVEFSSVW